MKIAAKVMAFIAMLATTYLAIAFIEFELLVNNWNAASRVILMVFGALYAYLFSRAEKKEANSNQ